MLSWIRIGSTIRQALTSLWQFNSGRQKKPEVWLIKGCNLNFLFSNQNTTTKEAVRRKTLICLDKALSKQTARDTYLETEQRRSEVIYLGTWTTLLTALHIPVPCYHHPTTESTWVNTIPRASKTLPTCITRWDQAVASWEAHYTCVVRLANITLQ